MALPTPGVTPANWGAQLNTEISATFDRVLPSPVAQTADYNTMTQSGWYVMNPGSANQPYNSTMFLEVRSMSTTYVEQRARNVTLNTEYRRVFRSSAWESWQKVNTLLYKWNQSGQSASIGDITYGLSPALGNLSGRNIKLTMVGNYDPAFANTGAAFDFYRAIDGAAGVPIANSFYTVAATDYITGFHFSVIDVPPAGSAVYYIRAQAHYQHGAVVTTQQFTIEDVGAV